MRYIIYCRKSTDTEDKQVMSLESQESELRQYADRLGLNVVEVLRESQSAKLPGRPVFNLLMQKLAKGEADGILCWKVDRLARNFIDAGSIIHSLQSNLIKEIRTPTEKHLPTDNVLMLSVQLGMANQYSRDLSENVKRGNRSKLERGEWPNHAPLGYLNDKNTKTIIPDPVIAPYVRRAFELYASGCHSLQDISNILYQEGLRTRTGGKVFKGSIKNILDKTFYYGLMERHGKFYQGNHKPLISKELYDQCREIASGVSRPRKKSLYFPLRGLVTCDCCPCSCTASLKKGHRYYYCTNGKGICDQHRFYTREEYLHQEVANILDTLYFDEELVEIMYLAAREKTVALYNFNDGQVVNTRKQLKSLSEREERLLDSYTSGITRKDLYESKMLEINNEREILSHQLKRIKAEDPEFTLEPTKKIFLEANKAKSEYLDGNNYKREKIAKTILWNLALRDRKIASYKLKKEYELIATAPKTGDISTLLPVSGWTSNF